MLAVLATIVSALVAISSAPADAASSGATTVAVTVLSATNLDTTGCASGVAGRTAFGNVTASSIVTSSDCAVTFGSSNSTATLSMAQSDGVGQALYQPSRGALDTSFDGDGVATLSNAPNSGADLFNAGAVQADGRVVAAGTCQMGGTTGADICMARFATNGTLDASFDGDGKQTLVVAAGSGMETAFAVAVQPDGKILVSGYCYMGAGTSYDFCTARYDTAGTLDPTFDTDGVVTTSIAPGARTDKPTEVLVQPDGKIVVTGYCNVNSTTSYDFCAARYSAVGALDTGFDGDGKLTTAVGAGAVIDEAWGAVLQADGKLVLAGRCYGGSSTRYDACFVRYTTTGALDTTWDGDGKYAVAVGAGAVDDIINDIALQPDGKVVGSGTCDMGATGKDICAVRLTTVGALDSTFSGDGMVTVPVTAGNGSDNALGIAVQSDGSLLLGGRCYTLSSGTRFCATRVSSTGALDASYGTGGTVVTAISPSSDLVGDALVQSDDKLVLVGGCTMNGANGQDGCLLRYTTAGAPDTTYSGDGRVTAAISVGNGDDQLAAALTQPDGKVVTAGTCDSQGPTGTDTCMERYLADGSLDPSFDGDGKTLVPVSPGGGDDGISALAQQPGGQLVAAGPCDYGGYPRFCLERYNPNGSLDTSFDVDGTVNTTIGSATASTYARAIALQPDGRIIAAGYCDSAGNYDFCAARYNADGSLDTTFATAGKFVLAIGPGEDRIKSASVQGDGRIVLAGYCDSAALGAQMCIVRLLATGAIDTSYGSSGLVMAGLPGNGDDVAYGAALQDDGKLLLGGSCELSSATTGVDSCVVRLTTAGALDTTFSGDGFATTPIAPSNAEDFIRGMSLQPDGRILLAGYCDMGLVTDIDFCASRFDSTGAVDTSFGTGGGTSFAPTTGAITDTAIAVAPTADGGFVIAGYCAMGGLTGQDQCLGVLDDAGTFPQYANGVNDWDQGAGTFGACLSSVTNGAGAWPMNATCPSTDGGYWNAIPAAATTIATAPLQQTGAIANLRFGARITASQTWGSYVAPITFSVAAP